MSNPVIISIFLSSPGDVNEERGLVEQIVGRINRVDGKRSDPPFRYEVIRWEKNVVPRIGPQPQKTVDEQTPPDYDIYLGILSSRFGTPTDKAGSGTEDEFDQALERFEKAGKPWILFYFDEDPPAPKDADSARQILKVQEFKERVRQLGLYASYRGLHAGEQSFFQQADDHLRSLPDLILPQQRESGRPKPSEDPTKYLRRLRDDWAQIDIRGLVGAREAYTFPIDELYISLTAAQSEEESLSGHQDAERAKGLRHRESMPLEMALEHQRLVVLGDPGAGKTTFLHRMAYELSLRWLGEPVGAEDAAGAEPEQTNLAGSKQEAKTALPGSSGRSREDKSEGASHAGSVMHLPRDLMPVYFRVGNLASFIRRQADEPDAPVSRDSAAWLARFLEAGSRDQDTPLTAKFFRQQLRSGACLIMADGLDEAPDPQRRAEIRKLMENVASSYKKCRMVVTSRPAAYRGESVLGGWQQASIDPLSSEAIETFLDKWCRLAHASQGAADKQLDELKEALRSRPEIRQMARTPVMLTALAVVHWNERRLPEGRADLYRSILDWLAQARRENPERPKAERCLELLQELALAMQIHPDGRQAQVEIGWASQQIAAEFASEKRALPRARRFLEAEGIDSGIIVTAGDQVRYWHLTFQEYLAARAIAARDETGQDELLLTDTSNLFAPEWREMALLLTGIIRKRGKSQADRLFNKIMEAATGVGTLQAKAQCLGLLGAALRDLKSLGYQPPEAYQDLQQEVLAIFDAEQSAKMPAKDRAAAGDALDEPGDPKYRGNPWVEIPAGKFRMGAQAGDPEGRNYDAQAYDDESPVHEVDLDSFKMARYPVTVREFEEFVEAQGYQTEEYWEEGGLGDFEQPANWESQLEFPNRPVVGVSWYEAQAFCRFKGTRLPSEEEWEYAGRGKKARKFPWGGEDPMMNGPTSAVNSDIPRPWASILAGPLPKVFSIWRATSGSGAGIRGARPMTARPPRVFAWCAAVPRAMNRGSFAAPSATSTSRASASTP